MVSTEDNVMLTFWIVGALFIATTSVAGLVAVRKGVHPAVVIAVGMLINFIAADTTAHLLFGP